jgi:hypothetical protein
MGTVRLQLPADLDAERAHELERGYVLGGPDNMPWPTRVRVSQSELVLDRDVEESGAVAVPWDITRAGRLMTATTTLMERDSSYQLQVELARGKVNQVRCQAADWKAGGLPISDELEEHIRSASLAFSSAALSAEAGKAQAALESGHHAASRLIDAYVRQVFEVRHQREPQLPTQIGCRLRRIPAQQAHDLFLQAFTNVAIAFSWSEIEATSGAYRWEELDALVDWAVSRGLSITAGPLIDFSSAQMPEWLWKHEGDSPALARFMGNYVLAAVQRFGKRIRHWHVANASNSAAILSLGEEDLLSMTVKLGQLVRQLDPSLQIITGIARPWGEYMTAGNRSHSPFIFADTAMRLDTTLAALDLEIVMGSSPRGSYCRDLLETSRLLDLYAVLGVPIRLTLGYPSSTESNPKADPELTNRAGHWEGGCSDRVQAEWAASIAALGLCKPYVQAIHWAHFSDQEPHQFPNCGLVNTGGKPKPALQALRELRTKHLC